MHTYTCLLIYACAPLRKLNDYSLMDVAARACADPPADTFAKFSIELHVYVPEINCYLHCPYRYTG